MYALVWAAGLARRMTAQYTKSAQENPETDMEALDQEVGGMTDEH